MEALLLLFSTFSLVFLVGLQYLNVTKDQVFLAMLTSVGISLSNVVVLKIIPSNSASLFEYIAYVIGGPLGISASMWFHKKFLNKEPG